VFPRRRPSYCENPAVTSTWGEARPLASGLQRLIHVSPGRSMHSANKMQHTAAQKAGGARWIPSSALQRPDSSPAEALGTSATRRFDISTSPTQVLTAHGRLAI
jgi:hypothetical protein